MEGPPLGAPLPPPHPGTIVAAPVAGAASSVPAAGPLLVLGAAIVTVLGALLPWARAEAGFISVNRAGTDGDGVLTLVLGLGLGAIAVVAMARRRSGRWPGYVAIALAALVTAIAVVDIVDVHSKAGDVAGIIEVSVGIGLWLTLVAGIAGAAGGFICLVRTRA